MGTSFGNIMASAQQAAEMLYECAPEDRECILSSMTEQERKAILDILDTMGPPPASLIALAKEGDAEGLQCAWKAFSVGQGPDHVKATLADAPDSVDECGDNLLIVAIKSGSEQCVSVVLQALRDLDASGGKLFAAINATDQGGATPLMHAAINLTMGEESDNYAAMVDMLLADGLAEL